MTAAIAPQQELLGNWDQLFHSQSPHEIYKDPLSSGSFEFVPRVKVGPMRGFLLLQVSPTCKGNMSHAKSPRSSLASSCQALTSGAKDTGEGALID